MEALGALADPTRRRIVDELAQSPRSVNELVGLFTISQPAVSKHLRVLKQSKLVRVQPDGRRRIYHLNPAPLEVIHGWLDAHLHLWADRLDALERYMDEEDDS